MEQLTKRQQEVYACIKKYIEKKGFPPTVREIGEKTGLSSSSSVHRHLTILENKGYIEKGKEKARALVLNKRG